MFHLFFISGGRKHSSSTRLPLYASAQKMKRGMTGFNAFLMKRFSLANSTKTAAGAGEFGVFHLGGMNVGRSFAPRLALPKQLQSASDRAAECQTDNWRLVAQASGTIKQAAAPPRHPTPISACATGPRARPHHADLHGRQIGKAVAVSLRGARPNQSDGRHQHPQRPQ